MIKIADRNFSAVIIGGSAGSLNVSRQILTALPHDFSLPIILVCHRHPDSSGYFEKNLNDSVALSVKQVDEKEHIRSGFVYVAPPNYHLLIEDDYTFSLTLEEPYSYSRPSIDVTFESASEVWGNKLIGVVLTGANSDGSEGLDLIKKRGGLTVVQQPETAEYESMPESAISAVKPEYVGTPEEIGDLLLKIHNDRSC